MELTLKERDRLCLLRQAGKDSLPFGKGARLTIVDDFGVVF